jgi:hypothetical protein
MLVSMGAINEMAREMGRRGAAGRLAKMTPEQRREVARLGAAARWRKAAQSCEAAVPERQVRDWFTLPRIHGDVAEYVEKAWSARIPKAWEEILSASMQSGDLETTLRILMAMTAMVPSLTPARLRQAVAAPPAALPAEPDLSHLSTEDLLRILER